MTLSRFEERDPALCLPLRPGAMCATMFRSCTRVVALLHERETPDRGQLLSFGPELSEKTPIVGPYPLLDHPTPIVKPKNVQ
jgi:hypothetical protein